MLKLKSTAEEIWTGMKRTKTLGPANLDTNLKRCLNIFDLTLLGLGNMAGSGIYVLTGTVIRDKAGPATFLSYLIAGITAFLNALCYAELGSRIPKAGSAYTYTYIASGEFLAFVIGWSIILEYALSVASVARGWSGTIDAMTHSAISHGIISTFGRFSTNFEFFGEYPDFLGAATILVLSLILSFGAKLSATVNSVLTLLNLGVIFVITIVMFSQPMEQVLPFNSSLPDKFMPFGFGGMVAGAGSCFYSFIGFDAITVSGEEAVNPKVSLPISTALSVSLITLLFVLASASLTMFVPWWSVDRQAAFTTAMRQREIKWATYLTGVGSLLGIGASLFTSLYAMPRIVYAIAYDGLLPGWIGYVLPSTQVPVAALAVFGGLAAILTLICDMHVLVEFLSIGTLIAFTIVCMNLCILRYTTTQTDLQSNLPGDLEEKKMTKSACKSVGALKPNFQRIPILCRPEPGRVAVIALICYVVCAFALAALILVGASSLLEGRWWAILLCMLLLATGSLALLLMLMHQQYTEFDSFKVPFAPVLPCMAIFLNMCLIVKLSVMTWIRFFVWLFIGLVLYFGYSIWHSKEATGNSEVDLLIPAIELEPQYMSPGVLTKKISDA